MHRDIDLGEAAAGVEEAVVNAVKSPTIFPTLLMPEATVLDALGTSIWVKYARHHWPNGSRNTRQ